MMCEDMILYLENSAHTNDINKPDKAGVTLIPKMAVTGHVTSISMEDFLHLLTC